jgi:hypothetical protein
MEDLFGYKPVILNKYTEIEFIDRIAEGLNDEISYNRHWYDFIKSPWFYVPVITLAIGCLFYSNFDAISNWFSGGNNPGPDSGGDFTAIKGSTDVPTSISGPVSRATLNPSDVPNNVSRRTTSNSTSILFRLPNDYYEAYGDYLRRRGSRTILGGIRAIESSDIDFRAPSPTASVASDSTITPN